MSLAWSGGNVAGSQEATKGPRISSVACEVSEVSCTGGGTEYSSPWSFVPGQPPLSSPILTSGCKVIETQGASIPHLRQLPLEIRSSRKSSRSTSPAQWKPTVSRLESPRGSSCRSETSPYKAPPNPEPWPDTQVELDGEFLVETLNATASRGHNPRMALPSDAPTGRAQQFRNRIITPETNPNCKPFSVRCAQNIWHPLHLQPKHNQELNDEAALLLRHLYAQLQPFFHRIVGPLDKKCRIVEHVIR